MTQLDTATRIDDLVRRTRAIASPAQIEQRTVPRASVSELAATDWDTVRDRLIRQRVDSRGPVEKFLDLLDAPRNQLFAMVAPGLEKRARERGERGAGGTGRVYFSDVLGELGMPSGITRGALGFAGDVLFDPLTWIGGPIFGTAAKGAKVTTEAGRSVRVGGAFVKGLKAAEKGKKVAPEIGRIVELAGGTEGLRSKVLGSAVPRGGPVRDTVSRVKRAVLGGDQEFGGPGLLAKYADRATTEATGETADLIRAFDDALLKYADGTGAGIRIGRNERGSLAIRASAQRGTQGIPNATQQIAHLPIPGTNFGLYVPAMSRRAQEAAATVGRASKTAEKVGVAGAIATARIGSLERATSEFQGMMDAYTKAYDDFRGFTHDNAETLRSVQSPAAEGTLIESIPGSGAIKRQHVDRVAALDAMRRDLQSKRAEIAALAARAEQDKTPLGLGQILLSNQKARESMATAALLDRRLMDLESERGLAMSLMADEAKRIEDGSKSVDRLIAFAQEERSPMRGPLLSSTDGLGIVLPGDTALVHRVSESVREDLDKYDAIRDAVIGPQAKGDSVIAGSVGSGAFDKDLAAVRERIWEKTAPLRVNATVPLDQYRVTIRDAWRGQLDTAKQQLLARMDAEKEVNDLGASAAKEINEQRALLGDDAVRPPPTPLTKEIDALHADMKTIVDNAFARRGSVLTAMTNEQRHALRLVGDVMGTNDPIVNTAFLTPFDTVAKWVSGADDSAVSMFLTRTGERSRRLFSGPPSLVEDAVRHAQRSLGDQAERNVERWMRAAVTDLDAIASKHGLDMRKEDLGTLATAFVIRNMERSGIGRPFRIDINGVPTGFAAKLDELAKSGILNPSINPGLADELEAFARTHGNDLLKTIRDAEREDDVLGVGQIRGAYLPGMFSKTAREAAATLRKSVAGGRSATERARLSALEAFQKEKSTDSVIFRSEALGRDVELFEADRVAQNMTKEEIGAIEDPEVRRYFAETKAAFDEYDRMPVQPPFMQNDPARINELYDRGRFRTLVGTDDLPGTFFETNLLSIMSSRLLQHEHAVARKTLEEMVLMPNALPIVGQEWAKNAGKIGAIVDLGNGTTGKVVRLSGQNGLEVGGQFYRALNVRGLEQDHPLAKLLTTRGKEALYPIGVAEPIERLAELLKPDGARGWLAGVDYLSRLIKSGMLMRLGWTIGNMIGETLNFTINDGNFPAAMLKYGKAAVRLIVSGKDSEALRRLAVDVRGERLTGEDLMRLVAAPVTDANRFTEANTRLVHGIGESVPSRLGTFRDSLPGRGAWSSDAEAMARHYAASGGSGGIKDYLKVRRDLFTDRFSRWMVEPWFMANGAVSDVLRTVAYLSLRDQGWDHSQAVNKMLNAGFDYSRITSAERGVAQRLFPFYCVPDHSEILTKEGWKHRQNLRVGEEVMTYSVERDVLEWQPCQGIAAFDHDQELTVISTKRGVRLESTDNHRWVVERVEKVVRGKRYGGDRRVVESRNLNKGHRLLMTAEFHGTESLLTPEQARLYGWLLTDGYWRFKGNSCEAVLYQSGKKFLAEVMEVAGGKKSPNGTAPNNWMVRVLQERIVPLLPLLRMGKDGCASVPCRLSRAAAEAMYDAMYKADGAVSASARQKNHKHFACMNAAKLECFQTLAFMLGKRTGGRNKKGRYVSDRRSLKIAMASVTKEHFTGTVWCPQTPNGTWVMRQNGTMTISGNTWMKNNGIYQAKMLLEHPIYVGSLPLVQHSVEEAINGDKRLPMSARPAWLREQFAIQLGTDPLRRSALGLSGFLPQEQGIQLGGLLSGGAEGAQAFARYGATSLNPVVRTPLEIGAGREFFSGRTIGTSDDQPDVTVLEHIGNQIGPYREYAKKLPEVIGEQGVGAGAIRLLVGGRAQPMTDERIRLAKVREFREKEEKIRRALRTAEFKKNPEARGAASYRLLDLYRTMMEQGYGDEVPKWARERLGTLTPA